jgi:hypothetical protein
MLNNYTYLIFTTMDDKLLHCRETFWQFLVVLAPPFSFLIFINKYFTYINKKLKRKV